MLGTACLFCSIPNIKTAHLTAMSTKYFSDLYNDIGQNLTKGELKNVNKPELFELLKAASSALKKAEETILVQSDALLKSPVELVKQCELTRELMKQGAQTSSPKDSLGKQAFQIG